MLKEVIPYAKMNKLMVVAKMQMVMFWFTVVPKGPSKLTDNLLTVLVQSMDSTLIRLRLKASISKRLINKGQLNELIKYLYIGSDDFTVNYAFLKAKEKCGLDG